jgi:hypothetical protein
MILRQFNDILFRIIHAILQINGFKTKFVAKTAAGLDGSSTWGFGSRINALIQFERQHQLPETPQREEEDVHIKGRRHPKATR